jgi:hypothetical protein
MTSKVSVFFIFSFALLFSSHLDARYKEVPLEDIALQISEGVIFTYKKLNKKDCKKYLKSSKILRKGYQPVQVTVMNNTESNIEISPKNFTDFHTPTREVSQTLHRNGFARGIGLAVPAVVIGVPVAFGSVYAGAMAVAISSAPGAVLGILLLPALALMSPFIITAVVQGCGAESFNENIDEIYVNKEFKKQVLQPGQTVSGLLFIPCDKVVQDFTDAESFK